MVKDEENKKKMFSFVKRLKQNTRRNQSGNSGRETTQSSNPTNTIDQITSQATNQANRATAETNEESRPINLLTPKDDQSMAAKSKTSEPNDNNCSICLRENNEPALCNECFHCFCFPCIEQWSQQSNQCPVCRREYSLILYNIRSETEYDQLPVSPRRTPTEYQLILPQFADINQFDRLLTRLLDLPPPNTLNAFNRPRITATYQPLQMNDRSPFLLQTPQLDTQQQENMMTFTITNVNPIDSNGNQIVERSFFQMIDQNDTDSVSQIANNQLNTSPPITSLEAQNNYRPTYNPRLIPENDPSQWPTIVFNPSNTIQPYRSIESYLNTPFWTSPFGTPPATTNRPPLNSIDTFINHLFEDLARRPATRHTTRNHRLSFPLDDHTSTGEPIDETANSSSRSNQIINQRRNQSSGRRRSQIRNRRTDSENNMENRENRNNSRNGRNSSSRNRNGSSTGRKK